MLARNQTKHGTYTVSVQSMKTEEGEISKINCAQTQPAKLTHTLGLIILLLRLLQKRALGKEAHLHQQTFFCKKTIFYVYILCVSCVSVSSVFPVSANLLKKPKKVSIMSSVESSAALATFLSGSSVLESCLAGAFVGPCKFYV